MVPTALRDNIFSGADAQLKRSPACSCLRDGLSSLWDEPAVRHVVVFRRICHLPRLSADLQDSDSPFPLNEEPRAPRKNPRDLASEQGFPTYLARCRPLVGPH